MNIDDAKKELGELIREGKVWTNCNRGVYPTPSEIGNMPPVGSLLRSAHGEACAQLIVYYLVEHGDQFRMVEEPELSAMRSWALREICGPAYELLSMMQALYGPMGVAKILVEWLPKAAPHLQSFEHASAFSRNWAWAMQMLPAKEA